MAVQVLRDHGVEGQHGENASSRRPMKALASLASESDANNEPNANVKRKSDLLATQLFGTRCTAASPRCELGWHTDPTGS